LHGDTIVDARQAGAVLFPAEIRTACEDFLDFVNRGSMSAD
jgi:hypothetical protein